MANNNQIGAGAIIEDSAVYSYFPAGCFYNAHDLRATHAQYSRVRNTRFFSGGPGAAPWTLAQLNSTSRLAGGDHDWTVGNTFAPLTALPAWTGPGDPTLIPLPLPASLAGEGACISPF
jgi:hypothetical protein